MFFSLKNFGAVLFSEKSEGATRIINHGRGMGVSGAGGQAHNTCDARVARMLYTR